MAGALSSTPDRSARSAAALGLPRSYPDFTSMAREKAARPDGIEAVSIVTPNHLHAPAAHAFLDAGIHVIGDKPSTSKPAPGHKIYPYLLRGMTVDRPDGPWAMDMTYVSMARGFVYLAAVVDWYSHRVLAWRLSITMEAGFCVAALDDALARHGRPEIFNTDGQKIEAIFRVA